MSTWQKIIIAFCVGFILCFGVAEWSHAFGNGDETFYIEDNALLADNSKSFVASGIVKNTLYNPGYGSLEIYYQDGTNSCVNFYGPVALNGNFNYQDIIPISSHTDGITAIYFDISNNATPDGNNCATNGTSEYTTFYEAALTNQSQNIKEATIGNTTINFDFTSHYIIAGIWTFFIVFFGFIFYFRTNVKPY